MNLKRRWDIFKKDSAVQGGRGSRDQRVKLIGEGMGEIKERGNLEVQVG